MPLLVVPVGGYFRMNSACKNSRFLAVAQLFTEQEWDEKPMVLGDECPLQGAELHSEAVKRPSACIP